MDGFDRYERRRGLTTMLVSGLVEFNSMHSKDLNCFVHCMQQERSAIVEAHSRIGLCLHGRQHTIYQRHYLDLPRCRGGLQVPTLITPDHDSINPSFDL